MQTEQLANIGISSAFNHVPKLHTKVVLFETNETIYMLNIKHVLKSFARAGSKESNKICVNIQTGFAP